MVGTVTQAGCPFLIVAVVASRQVTPDLFGTVIPVTYAAFLCVDIKINLTLSALSSVKTDI